MQRLMRWIHLLLLVCPLLGGCVSRPEPVSHPTLIGSFAEPDSKEPLIAEEAYIDDEDFYIRYRLAEQTLYTQGSWSDRISIVEPSAVDSPPPYIVPTARPTVERWKGLSEDAHPVRLLDERSWQEFRERFLGRFLSSTPQSGIVIHFNADDYFLYANEKGTFESVVIDQMPAGYQVTDELAFEELLDLGAPILEDYLNEIGVTERRVAFNTGDVGDYSLPFLYVNRDLPIAVFVRQQPDSHAQAAGTPATPLLQTAGHVVESHSTNLLARPLSSIYKLLFITSDTLAQTVKPEYLVSLEQDPIPPISDSAPMDLDRWEDELTRITGRTPSLGTVAHLIDGEEFFTRFITEVSSAESSISLRIYIFDNDDYALRIADLLRRRSNEGIEVKVLLDGLGTIISTAEKQETLPAGFAGVASVREYLEKDSNVDVRQASNPWLTGDHAKTVIIDRSVAFTGGMNIAREYRYDWHDMMVELRGPIVDDVQTEFEKAWAHAGFFGDFGYLFSRISARQNAPEPSDYPIRTLYTRVDDAEIFRVHVAAARAANRSILVENAYFTDDTMLYELAKARRRGVDVRVIMPLVTDRGPITRNNALAANALLEHGIRVYIYPGMSHVKAAIFDDWACLGSANWDRWSFKLNDELNIATSHGPAVEELRQKLFEQDISRSIELTEPFPERWSDFLLELVGDYIF